MYIVLFSVQEMIEEAEIRYDTKYASGLISVQMPIYLGTLHPDPVANVWRTRIVDIINKERWEEMFSPAADPEKVWC